MFFVSLLIFSLSDAAAHARDRLPGAGHQRKRSFFVIVISLMGAASLPVAAHSLEDLQRDLQKQERYAQFVDTPAVEFILPDLAGKSVSLAKLKGSVVVLNFVYARCTDVCPLHMALIARVQSMVNAAGMRERVQFVTIATDIEDVAATRKIMASYTRRYGLDTHNWKFLYRTAAMPPEMTLRVAEAYGLQFTPAGTGMQMHGLVTHVIDQTGRMRARFHGLKFEPARLVAYVDALVQDDHSR